MLSSTAVVACVLASSAAFVAADSGCSSLIDTANEAGLQELTQVLAAATPDLATSEIGRLVVGAAGLVTNLPADLRVTVFAPTDTAFATAAEKFGGELPQEALANVLLNHIVSQELTAEAIISLLGESGGSVVVPSLLGEDLFVTTDGSGIFVQSRGLEAPGATVTVPDQITCAGPVHVVDAVLLPQMPDGTVVEFGEAVPSIAPIISPIEAIEEFVPGIAPELAPEVAPEIAPDFALDFASGFAPEIAPETAPEIAPETAPEIVPGVDLETGPLGVIPEAAPVEGPIEAGDRGLGPIAFEPIAPVAGPILAPADGPLGEEPSADAADGPIGTDEGSEEAFGGAAEGASEDSAADIQAETDSALPSGFVSSTLAAVAVTVVALVV